MRILTTKFNADQLGIIASVSCAIHCAALPLLFTSLPLMGIGFLANIWIEITMIGISVLLGTYSLTKSYSKHQKITPFILLCCGFACIGLGHFIFQYLEAVFVPIGGLIIAISHFANWKLLKITRDQHAQK